jgi:hypothetical protein
VTESKPGECTGFCLQKILMDMRKRGHKV